MIRHILLHVLLLFVVTVVLGDASLIRGSHQHGRKLKSGTGEDRPCGAKLSDETLLAFGLDPLETQTMCEDEIQERADYHHSRTDGGVCISPEEVPAQVDTSVCSESSECLESQWCWLIQGNPVFTDCATDEELLENYGITPLQAFCIIVLQSIPLP